MYVLTINYHSPLKYSIDLWGQIHCNLCELSSIQRIYFFFSPIGGAAKQALGIHRGSSTPILISLILHGLRCGSLTIHAYFPLHLGIRVIAQISQLANSKAASEELVNPIVTFTLPIFFLKTLFFSYSLHYKQEWRPGWFWHNVKSMTR